MDLESLEQELVADLTTELEITDENFNPVLLLSKVRNAIREVKIVKKYPESYTDSRIGQDMYRYYSNIRNLAVYDYNTIGMEWQTSSSENSISRSMVDRNELFIGIIPISRA